MLTQLTDADLVHKIASNEPDAEAELYRRLAPRVLLYGLRHLRDRAAAEDWLRTRLKSDSEQHGRCSGVRSIGFENRAPISLDGPVTHVRGMRTDLPPRTFANCSGTITPWGTLLSCEENFQDQDCNMKH